MRKMNRMGWIFFQKLYKIIRLILIYSAVGILHIYGNLTDVKAIIDS